MDFSGKTLLVTGASGVLGRSVAARAQQLGASLVLLDVAFPQAELERNEAGVSRHVVDLTDAAATRACVEQAGRIDAVFNIAGGFDMGPAVHEITDQQWDFLFRMNVTTLHNVVRAVVPGMIARARGAIVNVGALGALKGQANMGAYCASKSVVMRLTESLSAELRDHGINVNAVLPSIIDTPRNRADMPDADFSKWVTPEQLANVMLFLASEEASAVHGALLPVTGRS